jgi:hypothetical protein
MHAGMNQSPVFCDDSQLDYGRSRTKFATNQGLELDESYRLAHLPLVAPDHPRVIASPDGKPYAMGRHPTVFSLGLPVDADALDASPPFRELQNALKAAPFAHKIAWPLLERRRSKLHATICNGLGGGDTPPEIETFVRDRLHELGPVRVELRGLFTGNVNLGRLYFKVHPERRAGRNVFHDIQRAFDRPETDLFVVGVYNLTDDLEPKEAATLKTLIDRWWDRPILRYRIDRLWLLQARDDLVLDGGIAQTITL